MSRQKPKRKANVVGPQVQKRRYELELTQEQFAAKCQLQGFDISRATLSQIEARLRCVKDYELLQLAHALNSSIESLFTIEMQRRRLRRSNRNQPGAV
jgi:transcriptional regulator with XRE-family HTH domain